MPRKRGKDKKKETFKKYGKYTSKNIRRKENLAATFLTATKFSNNTRDNREHG